MLRRTGLLLVAVLLWCAAAPAAVAAAALTNDLWRAEIGFLLVAGAVIAAWAGTTAALRRERIPQS
jgi:hypothetical protein